MLPAIFSLCGPRLTDDERALFRTADPAGFILFRRNVESPDQLRALTGELRTLTGRDELAVLIDQEGGRVARLREPHWPDFPAAAIFGTLYHQSPIAGIEAARANARALGHMLADLGLSVNCLPLLDLAHEGADLVMGDRVFGADPLAVAALGRATLEGLAEAGIAGVIKHMPGHGRSAVDSHVALPVVEADEAALARDLAPFIALADAAIGMTAHIVYKAWDNRRPATLSPTVVESIIRGRIGFDGLLLTDDIAMKALSGTPAQITQQALAAGCDLALHCSGVFAEMAAIAETAPAIRPQSVDRLARAVSIPGAQSTSGANPAPLSMADRLLARDAAIAERDQLLAQL